MTPCKSCVIVLCGVPGSGKTTISRVLQNEMASVKRTVTVVSFDDYEIPEDIWDEHTFEVSRQRGLEKLRTTVSEGSSDIVIVDDIMYYRSMRRAVYKIAREYSFGYATVHVHVPLDVALQRNSIREHPVPEKSLLSVHARFETPHHAGWESESLEINSCMVAEQRSEAASASWDCFEMVESMVIAAMGRVDQRRREEEKCQRAQREQESTESDPLQLTALDALIRKIVSHLMKNISSSDSLKPHARAIGSLLAASKQRTLQCARNSTDHRLVLPADEMRGDGLPLSDRGTAHFAAVVASCPEWYCGLPSTITQERIDELVVLITQSKTISPPDTT